MTIKEQYILINEDVEEWELINEIIEKKKKIRNRRIKNKYNPVFKLKQYPRNNKFKGAR